VRWPTGSRSAGATAAIHGGAVLGSESLRRFVMLGSGSRMAGWLAGLPGYRVRQRVVCLSIVFPFLSSP
jgi:hypothetical protein